MENKQLPVDVEERIKANAIKAVKVKDWGESLQIDSYILGATAEALKAQQGAVGWVKDRLPEIIDGKSKSRFVRVERKRHDGTICVGKAVAYYFPEHFKSVTWDDWDDYKEEDFPYTESDEEKGVVWLRPGWYEEIECDTCDNVHWSDPLTVIEWYDETSGTNELVAENERLKAEFKRIQKSAIQYANRKDEVEKQRDKAEKERGELKQENERLKASMQQIKNLASCSGLTDGTPKSAAVIKIATKALKEGESNTPAEVKVDPQWIKEALTWSREAIEFVSKEFTCPDHLVETWGNMYMNCLHAIGEAFNEIDDKKVGMRVTIALYEFVKDCAENWDHDSDSHTYDNICRKCEAQKLYEDLKQKKESSETPNGCKLGKEGAGHE